MNHNASYETISDVASIASSPYPGGCSGLRTNKMEDLSEELIITTILILVRQKARYSIVAFFGHFHHRIS